MGDLRDEPETQSALAGSPTSVTRLPWSALVFDGVNFRYDTDAPLALVDASLTIRRNEILGLVGHTGSGKSTLIDLILGLLEPEQGDIKSTVRTSPRSAGGGRRIWAWSHIYLLDDSILKNVAFGIPEDEIDRERVVESLRIAQLSDFVADSARGVETRIGERGTSVSGGERQRIAIARALYGSPSLLILDEGTSAIDTVTELNLVSELKRASVIDTIIVVSHRLSSLRICDSIAIIDHGRIVDVGDYDALIERNSILADLLLRSINRRRLVHRLGAVDPQISVRVASVVKTLLSY